MMHIKHKLTSIIIGLSIILPQALSAQATFPSEAFTQDFVLTAYYSPSPDQCCYVKGSFEADVVLNGNGTHGADGTPVYPGMIAAPPAYPFGTLIVLSGLGTLTVHDRGGAIQEQGDVHRIDVWAGSGEEGLARALAFGVKRIRGTVYPPNTTQPAESVDLAALPAPLDRLEPFVVADQILPAARPALGDRSLSVKFLQESLKNVGYFNDQVTGNFGAVTRVALQKLRDDFALAGGDAVNDTDAAYIEALQNRKGSHDPLAKTVDKTSTAHDVAEAKRTLRFLGYYSGRTNGQYDDALKNAILRFQQEQKLVADASSPGAGRIGPKTRALALKLWKQKLVSKQASQILARYRVEQLVAKSGGITSFLEKGDRGAEVKELQSFLASKHLLQQNQVSGLFGDATQKALTKYQIDAGIVAKAADTGAGRVGPATLRFLRQARVNQMLKVVRAQGWSAI